MLSVMEVRSSKGELGWSHEKCGGCFHEQVASGSERMGGLSVLSGCRRHDPAHPEAAGCLITERFWPPTAERKNSTSLLRDSIFCRDSSTCTSMLRNGRRPALPWTSLCMIGWTPIPSLWNRNSPTWISHAKSTRISSRPCWLTVRRLRSISRPSTRKPASVGPDLRRQRPTRFGRESGHGR